MNKLIITSDNSIINTIDQNISHGIDHGVLHLTADKVSHDGKSTFIDQHELLNFSSYSYLGLEHHPSLIKGCIDAVNKYGTQFGFSRAFVSLDLYEQLENNLSLIFKADVVVAPSTTLAHQAALPVIIEDNDLILIDQQAHASMHFSVKNVRDRGVKIELVRHNQIDKIEEKIIALRQKYKRIWYVCDGVYSMYGDYSLLPQLKELMDKYEQFHLYIDDAHGMSWSGVNGCGYVLSQIELHPQMILVTSLNKAFGAAGGVLVLPNKEWKRRIRTCGGTLIFSTPIQPPMLGVGVASSLLHLTPELGDLQNKLYENVAYANQKIARLQLPDISMNDSPIFYLPTSLPKVSYNISKKMMSSGFHVTPTLFPAVSMKRAGIRYCINVNHHREEIDTMLELLKLNYLETLEEEKVSLDTIMREFKLDQYTEKKITFKIEAKKEPHLRLKTYRSINELVNIPWNDLLGDNGSFDVNGLQFLEQVFQNNPEKENNWDFYYFVVCDENDKVVLATFITKCWCKDDIFKMSEISRKIEEIRIEEPYFLCTESLMMGTLITEGQHLYLNQHHKEWEKALLLFIDALGRLQAELNLNAVYLRDFDVTDFLIKDILISNGFILVDLPDFTHDLVMPQTYPKMDYLSSLTPKKRQQLKKDVLPYECKYSIEIKENVPLSELRDLYKLYLNVKDVSYIINTFTLPFSFFQAMNENKNWEMIVLSLKPDEYLRNDEKKPVAVVFAYKTKTNYIPLLVGLNYTYKYSHKNYKQSIFQVVKRADQLGLKKILFGITSTMEKRRVGARAIPKHVFVQVQDPFNMEVLQMFSVNETIEI